jgi:FAD/FMN-containing dehydrogenase
MISHTGVGGLTLGEGMGWLSRLAGLSIDNLVSAEIVVVDGRILQVFRPGKGTDLPANSEAKAGVLTRPGVRFAVDLGDVVTGEDHVDGGVS